MKINGDMNDLVFWATCFFQKQAEPAGKNDMPVFYLPEESSAEIAETLNRLGFEVTGDDVQAVYAHRI